MPGSGAERVPIRALSHGRDSERCAGNAVTGGDRDNHLSNAIAYYGSRGALGAVEIAKSETLIDNLLPLRLSGLRTAVLWSCLLCGLTLQLDAFGADQCALDQRYGNAVCSLFASDTGTWVAEPRTGDGQLHNRARVYADWLHRSMLPAGGAMRALFADPELTEPVFYGAERDVAIWTGAYLAAESLRLMTTGAEDAAARVKGTVQVIDRWWRISGDPGYLARYAAPEHSPQPILESLAPQGPDDFEVHLNVPFEGSQWRWRGQISRDQYQGILLGVSLAYDATEDEQVRALIRRRVVELAEQLMREQRRHLDIVVDGLTLEDIEVDLQHAVLTDDETSSGNPTLIIDIDSQDATGLGLVTFWPNPSDYIRQIPGFWWVPEVELPTQAIQLAAAFRVALQVTEGVPGWEARHAALNAHYLANVDAWLAAARNWSHTKRCGDAYFGINIGFMPLYTWARLDDDPLRRAIIQSDVLRDRFWSHVQDHKNVFFAFLYAAQAPAGEDISALVALHREQLAQFPEPPNLAVDVDLRGRYPEDPDCPGLSSVAIDVGDRAPTSFLWERHPWKLQQPGSANATYPSIDYLLAYWLGRYYGFISEDAPASQARWRTLSPPTDTPRGAQQLIIPSVRPRLGGAEVRLFYLPLNPFDETLGGLGIRLHWDSLAARLTSITEALPQGLQSVGAEQVDALDYDGNPATDRFVELVWTSPAQDWPGNGTTPAQLFVADLDLHSATQERTALGVSALSAAPGCSLAPWLNVLDVDGWLRHQVQQMYVAYYGRPGDPAGVDYWSERLRSSQGQWTTEIIDNFGNSAEYRDRFGSLAPEQLIDNLYRQMFGRPSEPVGQAYYVDLLSGSDHSGLNPTLRRSSLAQIALDIANGAQDEDAACLANKRDVAGYFTRLVDQNQAAYRSDDIADAVDLLALVDAVPSSIVWQMLAVDRFVTRAD